MFTFVPLRFSLGAFFQCSFFLSSLSADFILASFRILLTVTRRPHACITKAVLFIVPLVFCGAFMICLHHRGGRVESSRKRTFTNRPVFLLLGCSLSRLYPRMCL